jgi:phosphate acetyltransferase
MKPDPEAGLGDFLTTLRGRAAARMRTLVFPEGNEPRIHAAVRTLVREGLVRPVLIGTPAAIREGLRHSGTEPDAVEIIDSSDPGVVDQTHSWLQERRANRRDEPSRLETWSRDPLMQGGRLVSIGQVDGAVAGCARTTGDVVRAALTCVGLEDGIQTLSSSFYMVFDRHHRAGPGVLSFTDAGVVPEPEARQLADIAAAAVTARGRIVGDEARVAFLSYSTHGSADGKSVQTVRQALELFRRMRPDVLADGELQADAALVPAVAERKAPGSVVGGRANVLVFPDLDSANVAYKLVQYLGGASALGPVLQGLSRPYNDLSRGADAADIVSVGCITSLMAD